MTDQLNFFHQARFLISAEKFEQSPPDEGREVAFAGRSNSGKSSAINAICNQKALARTSRTPGRTQLLNFFSLDESRRFVDLPGYGYAKVPVAQRKRWEAELTRYLTDRQSLSALILMMDARHPMSAVDRQMLEFAEHYELPVHVLLTKADKLSRGPANAALLKLRKMLQDCEVQASAQLFSALKKQGLEEAAETIGRYLNLPDDKKNPDD